MKKILIIIFILITSLVYSQRIGMSLDSFAVNITNTGKVGIGTKNPLASRSGLDISCNKYSLVIGANSNGNGTLRTNNQVKIGKIVGVPCNFNDSLIGIIGYGSVIHPVGNYISYGGALSYESTVNRHSFYLAKYRGEGRYVLDMDSTGFAFSKLGSPFNPYKLFTIDTLFQMDSLGNTHIAKKLSIGAMGNPTNILDVYGNGGTDNLLKVSNDINSTYDSTFVVNKDGKVGIGTTTPAAALHIKGGSERLGVVTYSTLDSTHLSTQDVRCTDTIKTSGTFYYSNAGSTLSINSAYGIVIKDMAIFKDSAMFYHRATTLSDEEVYTMPTSMSWDLQISVDSAGKKLTSFHVVCDADGTVMLGLESPKRWSSITYLSSTNSDGYFCVYDAGTGMAIKNRLGYTVKVTIMGAAKI